MLVVGRMYEAWALAQQSPSSEHVNALADNLAEYRKTGAGLQVPHYLTMLAESLAMTGELDRAMEVLGEASELARTHDAYLYEPEVLRMRAALLTSTDPEAAASTFRAALRSARATGARLLELRCAIGLSTLLANEGRYEEAVQELSPFLALSARDIPDIDFEELTASSHVGA
jgi:tetratricopeptide (TPR) repeat protein